jgi:excisionase family DNA binding protein
VASLSTGKAAARLGVSKPTVRKLIETGRLKARREPRGGRFRWLVDEIDVHGFLSQHGPVRRRRRGQSRVAQLEADLAALRDMIEGVTGDRVPGGARSVAEGERDDLRAEVVSLQEALMRSHAVADFQSQADHERSEVVTHLLAAAAAAERADAYRRRAISEYEEAVAAFARPGHPGQMKS